MAIQFLRGTSTAINASNKTLKKGQPLLNLTTGHLYIGKAEGVVNGNEKFEYSAFDSASSSDGNLVVYKEGKFVAAGSIDVDSEGYLTITLPNQGS